MGPFGADVLRDLSKGSSVFELSAVTVKSSPDKETTRNSSRLTTCFSRDQRTLLDDAQMVCTAFVLAGSVDRIGLPVLRPARHSSHLLHEDAVGWSSSFLKLKQKTVRGRKARRPSTSLGRKPNQRVVVRYCYRVLPRPKTLVRSVLRPARRLSHRLPGDAVGSMNLELTQSQTWKPSQSERAAAPGRST